MSRAKLVCSIGVFLILAAVPARGDGRGCKRAGKHCRADSQCCDGLVCGDGGTCEPACRIDGTIYPADAISPNNACLACRPEVSTSGWSNVEDGNACSDGDMCTT